MAEPGLKFTKKEYDLLPEGLRVELIDGEILKMAPPTVLHQELAKRVFLGLMRCVGPERAFFGPIGFDVNDVTVLVPDVVAFRERVPDLAAGSLGRAELVAEVLSPSTAARDRNVKAELYLAAGVAEVWLIDPRARTIEIRTGAGERAVTGSETAVSEALPGFALTPSALFA